MELDPTIRSLEFPNVGAGPDPASLEGLVAESAFVALVLAQSARSGTCRQQVRELGDEYDAFRRRDATVAAVVPGRRTKVRSWRRLVDPPFPVLADEERAVGEAFRQSSQYGRIGRFAPSIGRVPMTVVLDCRGDEPSVIETYEGETAFDRPSAPDLLATIDRAR